MNARIFISYRRDDAAGYAGRLADHLGARFGDADVFRDIEDLEGGVDFEHAIVNAVSTCGALVVVIGPGWLDAVDAKTGGRRLDDPKDYVRLEIEAALDRNVLTLPVLVRGTEMPPPDALPESLRPLAKRQALPLSDDRWSFDVERVIRALEPVARSAHRPPRWRAVAGFAAAGALLLAVGLTAWTVWNGRAGTDSRSSAAEGQKGADGAGEADRPVDGGTNASQAPRLVGLPLDEALAALTSAGLRPGTITKTTTGTASPDHVYAQRPEAGTLLDDDAMVSLLVEYPLPGGAVSGGERIRVGPRATLQLDGPDDPGGRRGVDFVIRESDGDILISPLSGTVMAIAPIEPSQENCRRLASRFTNGTAAVREAMNARGICARTTMGNLAAITISAFEARSGEITLGFVTWSGR